jgi:hypothetical protein
MASPSRCFSVPNARGTQPASKFTIVLAFHRLPRGEPG